MVENIASMIFVVGMTFFFLVPNIHSSDFSYTPCDTKETFDIAASVKYLRANIGEQLQAKEINFEVFKMILNHHNAVSKNDKFVKETEQSHPRRHNSFYTDSECSWRNPDFCDYSCDGSFAGRCSTNTCENECQPCCQCLFYVPCGIVQTIFGWLLPCGYSNGCCCAVTESKLDEDQVREYLKALQTIYAGEYWNDKVLPSK